MPRRDDLVSEADARALWERASEMQQEAARRTEERAAILELGQGARVVGSEDGFRLDEVAAAAREAGISPEYLGMAVAELEVTRKPRAWMSGRRGRGSRHLLPDQLPALELARVIRAAPEAVLEAVMRLFPAEPFTMVLEDSMGDDPLEDGVYVFRVPAMNALSPSSFAYEMACATVSHLLLTVRPLHPAGAGDSASEGNDPGGTEVILRAPLLEHTRQSYWLSMATTGLLGAGGGGVGVGAGLATVGALAGAPLLAGVGLTAAAVVGLATGGGLGVWSGRAIYRWGIGKGQAGLENLLKVLDANARTRGAFPAGGGPASKGAIG